MHTQGTCPHCGGHELYRSVQTTAANGLFGPRLLPKFGSGRFRVVVCRDCGLTQLFASTLDSRALGASAEWESMADLRGPLGLSMDSN